MEEVTVVEVPPMKVVGMRKRGKYLEIGSMIGAVYQYIAEQGAVPMGPPIYVGHEMSEEEAADANKAGNADLEVAAPVMGDVAESEEMKTYELPGGTMAKIVHKGPYQECKTTYGKLFMWIGQNNEQVTGPIREVYLNDPTQVSPEELLTEIYAPIDQ
jgi:AraC family transcriptional regulator